MKALLAATILIALVWPAATHTFSLESVVDGLGATQF